MQVEMFKNGPQMFDMLLLGTQIDYNIIKVYKAGQEIQLSQTVGHQPLKSSQGIAQPKSHAFTLEEA